MANQFIRKITLIVSNDSGQGLDLSEFRIRFHTQQSDVETPNTLWARVYNLSDATIQKIKSEFQTITLQAGYENGNFGIIFQGIIKQWWQGRERNVDSFFEIAAADGDEFYNFAVLCQSITAGQSPQQILQTMFSAGQYSPGLPLANDAMGLVDGNTPAPSLPRGKVMFGMVRSYARDWAAKYGYQWSIQNGQVTVVPITGYRPGEAVKLTSTTGLVFIPETTNDGIQIRALLNPLIRVGCLVQVEQSDINTLTTTQFGLRYTQTNTAAATTKDGYYRVLISEFHGDTRGQEWYTELTCLAVDITADPNQSVQDAG